MIRPYLSSMINNQNFQVDLKTQLTVSINYMPSKDSEETCSLNTKSLNVEFIKGCKTEKIVKEFLNLFCKNMKTDLKNQ